MDAVDICIVIYVIITLLILGVILGLGDDSDEIGPAMLLSASWPFLIALSPFMGIVWLIKKATRYIVKRYRSR